MGSALLAAAAGIRGLAGLLMITTGVGIAVAVFGRLRNRRTSQTVVAQDATGGNLQVLLRMIDRRTAIRMFGMSALFIGPAGSARRVTGALPAPAGQPAARGLLARCPTQTDTWNLGANAPAKGRTLVECANSAEGDLAGLGPIDLDTADYLNSFFGRMCLRKAKRSMAPTQMNSSSKC
jgi:hypothetical protein